MRHRSTWVIATLFALAMAASLFAVWYLNMQSRRALAFWGPDAAQLIVQAGQAEVLRLEPLSEESVANDPAADTPRIEIGGDSYAIVERRDAVAARGFIHIRRGLMNDAAFDWQAEADSPTPRWEYAIRFAHEGRTATLAFAFDPPLTTRVDRAGVASIVPVAKGLETFFREVFQTPPASPAESAPSREIQSSQ